MSSPSSSPGFQRPVGIPSFDPRQVPISGRDSHLPAVAHQAQTEQALRQRFAKPPLSALWLKRLCFCPWCSAPAG
jgi:hypothetical protein